MKEFMKSEAEAKNERYMPKGIKEKVMGHEKAPIKAKMRKEDAPMKVPAMKDPYRM